MATRRITAFPILLSIVAVWVVAVPVQLQAGANALRRDMYGPATTEFLGGYLDDHDAADPRNSLGGRRIDFDFPYETTFERIHGLSTGSRRLGGPMANGRMGNANEIHQVALDRFAKRNIDEIDRTPFDNFFKRNLDEIDRDGWIGFVKRLDDYLAMRRSGLERAG
ncbi:orcokinin peptides-like isoform X2 [Colletes gigas]|uniref:orcokinin peptides-like isoform X2 n=1 Tax=Colletes gigas TaxID=935657 RepID=UPI001C9B497D|nr:orcokinin peptides-like isoform X2 [Colletes gigas]